MKLFFPVLFFFSSQLGLGQSFNGNIASAYQQSVNRDFSIEWIVGQDVITETFTTEDNFTLSSGLTSADETLLVLNINESIQDNSKFIFFPNPFSKTFTIKSADFNFVDMKFNLFNVQGQMIPLTLIGIQKHNANFYIENLPSGLYILNIAQKDKKPFNIKVIHE